MSDVIANMTGPQLIGLVAVSGGLILALVGTVAGIVVPFVSAARRAEALCQLKRELVAAGYSADDIERIVKAGADQASTGYSAEDVERVVKAGATQPARS